MPETNTLVGELLQQRFKQFLKYYPMHESEQVMKDLAESLRFELTEREIELLKTCEKQMQERFVAFTQSFMWQEIEIPGQTGTITVKDVMESKKIKDDWDKIQTTIEADPSTKKQWEDFVLLLRLGNL